MVKMQFGVGLRACHYSAWKNEIHLPLFELLADNYMFYEGGPSLYHMKSIVEKTQVVIHGVGMNIAGVCELDLNYVHSLKNFCNEMNPLVVSDHLCFSKLPTHNSFDLLPIPFTKEMCKLVCKKIDQVQSILNRQFSLENISSYVSFKNSEYTEIQFLNEVCRTTGCGILLDVNNIYVSGKNHGFSPLSELEQVNPKYVTQYHIAGHSYFNNEFLFDSHDQEICTDVWNLMLFAIDKIGYRPAIIERDDNECSFNELLSELQKGNNLLCPQKNS